MATSRSAALAASVANARAKNASEVSSAKAAAAKAKTSTSSSSSSSSSSSGSNNSSNAAALLRAQQLQQAATGTLPTNADGSKVNTSQSKAIAAIAKSGNASLAGNIIKNLLNSAGGKTTTNDLYSKDQTPTGNILEENYDYTQGNKYLGTNAMNYLTPRATTTPQATQQTSILAMIAELMKEQEARQASQVSNIAQTYQVPEVEYYNPIEEIANIAPISSAGDNITPTISAYTAANDAATNQQAAYNDQYNAVTAAQTAEAGAMNDSVNTIAGLLESLLSDENADASLGYNYDLLDYNKSQDAQTAAAQRIIWGIASNADYNLLGINPNAIPYEQLNAMVEQDNERKKTELYGLGLTV